MATLSRRALLGTAIGAVVGGAAIAPLPALMPVFAARKEWIPQRPSARVIVDNDFAGDPDGLLALAHQLLTPKTVVPLVTVSLLNPKFSTATGQAQQSSAAGAALLDEMMRNMGCKAAPRIVAGQEMLGAGHSNAAAEAIVVEAMRDDPMPLFLTCGGPLTNVAAALRLEPRIAQRMTLIWIGGGGYPNAGWEYNANTDLEAARTVIAESAVPLWQIPQPTYRQMQIAIAELSADMKPISPFSQWLYSTFTSPPDFVDLGGTWPMGDSPLVLLTGLSGESSRYHDRTAQAILDDGTYGAAVEGRSIRVYDTVDVRLTHADFMAKMRLHAAGAAVC